MAYGRGQVTGGHDTWAVAMTQLERVGVERKNPNSGSKSSHRKRWGKLQILLYPNAEL